MQNGNLADKLDDLEDRNRRNNLVIFGGPESKNEDCRKAVTDYLFFEGISKGDVLIERTIPISIPSFQ